MAGLIEKEGGQAQKQTRYAPIFTNRFFTGLYTQRNPLRDAASTRLEEKYYGGRGDGLIDGSNTEISNRLTLIRRPGLSVYNSQTFSATDFFYSFKLQDGSIRVIADTLDGVYDITGPDTKLLLFAKNPGDGQTFFQSVLDILYLSNKTQQYKYVQSPKTWACNTQFFPGDFIVDPNGNLERVARVIDLPPGNPESPTVGPNTAQTGANSGPGVAWSNPGNVSSNSAQATVSTLQSLSVSANNPSGVTPQTAGQYTEITGQPGGTQWRTNQQDTGTLGYLIYSNFPSLSVPAGATILGVTISFTANSDTNTSTVVSNVSLFAGASPLGTAKPVNQTLTPTVVAPTFTFGGNTDLWGATITDVIVNGSNFGFGVQLANLPGHDHSFLYQNSTVSMTVYYEITNTNASQLLKATDFGFSTTSAPMGVQVQFDADLINSLSDAIMTVQLILSGSPLGAYKVTVPGSALSTITLGGTNDLWGTALSTSDVNDPTFGVEFRAFGGGDWAVGNVKIILTTSVDNLVSGSCSDPPPVWPLNWGASVVDGNITWINNGPALQKFAITPPTNAPSVTNVLLTSSSIGGLSPWQASTWYLNALRIDDGTNIQMVTTAGVTGASQPAWNATPGGTTTDGTVVWTNKGSNAWQATHVYATGDAIVVNYNSVVPVGVTTLNSPDSYEWPGHINQYGNDFWTNSVTVKNDIFIVFKTGRSATTQPTNPSNSPNTPLDPYPPSGNTWQSGIGTKVVDGNVIWQNSGPTAIWNDIGALQNVASVNLILDINSNQQQATVTGETATVHPAWSPNVNQITTDNSQIWLNKGVITSGVTAIPTTSTLAAQSLTWTYYYTYRNSLTGDESSASPASADILLASNSAISIQGQNSSDPQVDTIRIYRTTAGGGVPFLLVEIPNVALTGNWSYIDTTPDSGLNNLITAPLNEANNPPPVGLINLTFHLERIFGSIGNTVYYSGGPDTNPGNGATAFDPLNYFVFPSKVTRMVATSFGILVFTIDDIYLIAGQGTASSPLFAQPYAQGIGLLSYNELDINAGIIYLRLTDGRVAEIQVGSGISELGTAIGDQFTKLTTGTGNGFITGAGYLTWHCSGSEDKAIYVSNGTDGWFRCSPTSSPETGINWCPKATLANPGGAMAVQSIEVSPGVKKLLVGPATSGPILMRDLDVNSDNGEVYPCFATIGGLTLAQPGQTAPVVFVATDCLAIGSHIIPSSLLDELPSAGTFNSLAVGSNPVPDPPQLVSSTTVFNDRWWLHETQVPMLCRWMFLNLAWVAEDAANELLEFTIFGSIMKE